MSAPEQREKANNPEYFGIREDCSPTSSVWLEGGVEKFSIDLANRKVHESTLKWHDLHNQILSTLEFTDTPKDGNIPKTGCVISGCNGELCASEALTSTCVYKNEYACYTTARCEVQENDKCGWTQTEKLTSCISEAK